MAASKIVMQSADGASVGLTIPDGLTSGERTIALGANLSGVTAYHLLNGEVSVSNGVITSGFSTTLYTGNGTTQAVNTGIDMDTQWGNDASERFGGLVWGKSRSSAISNCLYDTVRGVLNRIESNATSAQVSGNGVSSFTSSGFALGNTTDLNTNLVTYASWNFQTTHRRTGTTNHGKAFTEHYNPFTGFTIIKYEGSGLAGHEIPHSLGRKLGFVTTKNLGAVSEWVSQYKESTYLYLNQTIAETTTSINITNFGDSTCTFGTGANNTASNQYIIYGWANSYFDESNKLIGNYEIGVYQGTGAAGNKVKTKGKPAWLMVKRLDAAGNWVITDNKRGDLSGYQTNENLLANASTITNATVDRNIQSASDGFLVHYSNLIGRDDINASGGQYLYMVVYDNDSGSGKSKYPKATDSSQLQINALIPFANGVDGNGAKNTILSKNETITGLTLTQGKNYVYSKNDGTYGVKPHRPRYLSTDLVRTYAGENPDYYDVVSNKWFNCDAGAELVTNGKFDSGVTTGWTADGTNLLSISNGTMLVNRNNSTSSSGAKQTLTTEIGKKYIIKFKITSFANSGTSVVYIGSTTNGSELGTLVNSSTGTVEYSFIAQTTSTYVQLGVTTSVTGIVGYDDISCFQTDITPTSEITESRNYLDAIVYADHNGQIEYVEQLPKTQYVDEMKANEFKGKNTCTAWVNFDGTTTPPTIRDSYNVSSVVRTATGKFRVYFEHPMDNTKYSGTGSCGASWTSDATDNSSADIYYGTTSFVSISTSDSNSSDNSFVNYISTHLHIFGGKN